MCLKPSLSEILHVNNAADIDDLNLSSHAFGNCSLKNYFYYLVSKLQGIKMNFTRKKQ